MSDLVIIDGDSVQFLPTFGAANVVVRPGKISASGSPSSVESKLVCVEGDESSVKVPGCAYATPQYSIPGAGTLKIDSLANDQLSQIASCQDKALILKGNQFNAVFEVQTPAQQPQPSGSPVPDSTPSYSGKGSFINQNTLYQAS